MTMFLTIQNKKVFVRILNYIWLRFFITKCHSQGGKFGLGGYSYLKFVHWKNVAAKHFLEQREEKKLQICSQKSEKFNSSAS
jgi:hypothetical protein